MKLRISGGNLSKKWKLHRWVTLRRVNCVSRYITLFPYFCCNNESREWKLIVENNLVIFDLAILKIATRNYRKISWNFRINIKDIRKLTQRYRKLGKTCFYKLGSSARINPFSKVKNTKKVSKKILQEISLIIPSLKNFKECACDSLHRKCGIPARSHAIKRIEKMIKSCA